MNTFDVNFLGAIGCPTNREYVDLLKKAGFDIIVDENLSVGGYQAPMIDYADRQFNSMKGWFYFAIRWRLVPRYFKDLFDRFCMDGQAFVEADRTALCSTSYYIIAQKPFDAHTDVRGYSPASYSAGDPLLASM